MIIHILICNRSPASNHSWMEADDQISFLITLSDPCHVIALLIGLAGFPMATGQAVLAGLSLSGRFYQLNVCNRTQTGPGRQDHLGSEADFWTKSTLCVHNPIIPVKYAATFHRDSQQCVYTVICLDYAAISLFFIALWHAAVTRFIPIRTHKVWLGHR